MQYKGLAIVWTWHIIIFNNKNSGPNIPMLSYILIQFDLLIFSPISSFESSLPCLASVFCSNEAYINISIKREQLFLMSDVISCAACNYSTNLRFSVKWIKCISVFVKLDNNSLWHRSGAKPCEEPLFHSLGHGAHLPSKVTVWVFSSGAGDGL